MKRVAITLLLVLLTSNCYAAYVPNNVVDEDTSAASGDKITPVGIIQQSSPADAGTNGDYVVPQMSGGRVWASTNVDQIGGIAPNMGAGIVTTGTQRVFTASGSTIQLATGTNIIGSLSANQSMNQAQTGGVTTSMGAGAVDTGTQRVFLASQSTVQLVTGSATIGALSANQSVNVAQMGGTTTVTGAGPVVAGVQRVFLASQSTVQLVTGTATIGALTANQTVDQALTGGVATNMGAGVVATGTQRVFTATGSTVALTSHASSGWTPATLSTLSTTVLVVKNSAGSWGGYYCYNPTSSAAFVQVFDKATTGSVTLGSTNPVWTIGIPATSAANLEFTQGVNMGTGIAAAATTTASGSTITTQAINCNFIYR